MGEVPHRSINGNIARTRVEIEEVRAERSIEIWRDEADVGDPANILAGSELSGWWRTRESKKAINEAPCLPAA